MVSNYPEEVFITAKIAPIFTSLSTVHICDFHKFTVIYSSLHGFIWNQRNDQLPVGSLVQGVDHCTGIAEIIFSIAQVVIIIAKITFIFASLSAVHIRDFHLFTLELVGTDSY